jgi:proline iminopeptidase
VRAIIPAHVDSVRAVDGVPDGRERRGDGWDHLDSGDVPSAERTHPEWQRIAVGDRLHRRPAGAWFEVAAIDLRPGRPFDPAGPRPRFYLDLWGFQLKEPAGRRTRLVVSGYPSARPRLLQRLAECLFWEPAHWIMQTRQFANRKRRAEGERAPGAAPSPIWPR